MSTTSGDLSTEVETIPSASSSPFYGARGGEEFNDYDGGTLVGIAIRAGEYSGKGNLVHGITLFYRGGNHNIMSYGGNVWEGTEEYIILHQDEYVTQAEIKYSDFAVTSLLFKTNQRGKLGPYGGGGGGKQATVTAPSGQMIVGIHGRVGYALDGIGFHFRPISHLPPSNATTTTYQKDTSGNMIMFQNILYGPTPLHHACMFGFAEDMKILIEEYSAALMFEDCNGDLPLHIALRNKASDDVINMLVGKYPEAAEVKNRVGELPLVIAQQNHASAQVKEKLSLPCYGGNGGEKFDDYDEGTLVGIAIRAGDFLDKGDLVHGITLFFRGGNHNIMSYGGNAWKGTEKYIILHQGEYVTQAEIKYSDFAVTSLLFRTNQRRKLGPCGGGGGGKQATVTAPSGQMIVGIKGSAAFALNSIGFHFRPISHLPPSNATTTCPMNRPKNMVILQNKYGPTPLHHACMFGFAEDMKILIEEYSAALMFEDCNGDLPLHIALRNKASDDVIEMLLKAYSAYSTTLADAKKIREAFPISNNQELPLHIFVKNKPSPDVIEIFLEASPDDVKVPKEDGSLPLHLACQYGASPAVVKLLYQKYKDAKGKKDKQQVRNN
jgi:ankyrin repeat protein